MRVCDRCRGGANVKVVRLTMAAENESPVRSAEVDLCEDCRGTFLLILAAAPWEAPELLKVLDGEPSARTTEAAKKLPGGGEEIPFDPDAAGLTPAAARRWLAGARAARQRWEHNRGSRDGRLGAGGEGREFGPPSGGAVLR